MFVCDALKKEVLFVWLYDFVIIIIIGFLFFIIYLSVIKCFYRHVACPLV
jgi:hypothetical protein